VQIVIGTPGRVMDHMERGTLKLDALRLVVLDEADRMLDMGFRDDIEHILSAVPPERQLLFFSATMPRAIQDLIGRYSRDPAWIKVESHAQNAPQVDQVYFEVDRRSKLEVLTRLIDINDFRYGLIFCSTKVMVDELDQQLHARGYATDRLHGDLSQMQRTRVMEKFRKRAFEFLVATDVAARGLDVDDLEVVFNFDLPNDAEDYTHRIGRTARAGKSGKAVTFVSGRELYRLQSMVRFANLKIRIPRPGRRGPRKSFLREDPGCHRCRPVREAGPGCGPAPRPGLFEYRHLLGPYPASKGRGACHCKACGRRAAERGRTSDPGARGSRTRERAATGPGEARWPDRQGGGNDDPFP